MIRVVLGLLVFIDNLTGFSLTTGYAYEGIFTGLTGERRPTLNVGDIIP